MLRTTNSKCSALVEQRKEFQASNLYARWMYDRYVVFSYGPHWPLFVYDQKKGWFENSERYSVSTSKHRTQSHPCVKTELLTRGQIQTLIS